jgi:hypothetical protein
MGALWEKGLKKMISNKVFMFVWVSTISIIAVISYILD